MSRIGTYIAAAAVALLTACTVSAPKQFVMVPLEPPPVSAKSPKPIGEQVAAVHEYCHARAIQECPAITIRCEAFRPSYVKSCMLKGNVPADYIAALAR